jgi:hypothetical protein
MSLSVLAILPSDYLIFINGHNPNLPLMELKLSSISGPLRALLYILMLLKVIREYHMKFDAELDPIDNWFDVATPATGVEVVDPVPSCEPLMYGVKTFPALVRAI